MPTRKRRTRGAGIFGSIWSGIKKVGNTVSNVKDVVKQISDATGIKPSNFAPNFAKGPLQKLGLGRRRRKCGGGFSNQTMHQLRKTGGAKLKAVKF